MICSHFTIATAAEHQPIGLSGAMPGRYDVIAILAGARETNIIFAVLQATSLYLHASNSFLGLQQLPLPSLRPAALRYTSVLGSDLQTP